MRSCNGSFFTDSENTGSLFLCHFATSGGSSIDKANAEFKAQYPEINWKAGKTLNHATKAEIQAWHEGLSSMK